MPHPKAAFVRTNRHLYWHLKITPQNTEIIEMHVLFTTLLLLGSVSLETKASPAQARCPQNLQHLSLGSSSTNSFDNFDVTEFADELRTHTSYKSFKTSYCKEKSRLKSDKRYAKLDRQLRRTWQRWPSRLAIVLASCAAIWPTNAFAELQEKYRSKARYEEERDLWSEHGSNPTQLLMYQTLASCFFSGGDRVITQILIPLVAAGVNFHEEVKFYGEYQKGLPGSNSSGEAVQTDWKDFASGMTGVGLFILFTHAVDRTANLLPIRCT